VRRWRPNNLIKIIPLTSPDKAGNFYTSGIYNRHPVKSLLIFMKGIWVSSNSQAVTDNSVGPYRFRWKYIILPVILLIITVVLVLVFYSRLSEQVAYRFFSDGSAERLTSRGSIILWTLLPQILLALSAVIITRGVTRLANRFITPDSALVNPERIILLMGNMIVLPQVILTFAMVDIFSYNSYQVHLMPIWVFAIIVLMLGGFVLTIFSFQIVRMVWRANKE